MTEFRQSRGGIGVFESALLLAFGVALVLVFTGSLDPVGLMILVIWGFIVYSARQMITQAQRFRPVEPPGTWAVTLIANIVLMAVGLGAFGWYLLGGGAVAWIPLLLFIAGMIALRQWRQGVTSRIYAWRTPALTLLQRGDYKKLVHELENDPTARRNPDKLAVLALAYIELNKFDTADNLLTAARQLAPEFASVNGAIGSLRRHQARYRDAAAAIRKAIAFEENVNSRYYLGLCQFLDGDVEGAARTLRPIIDDAALGWQGRVVGAYILGLHAEQSGDAEAAQGWYARMAEQAPKVIPQLDEEARRHKQTAYGDDLKSQVRAMQQIIARRPVKS